MDNKKIIKITNRIGIGSIILLIYWVFTFIMVTVFDFKVFRQNITETFFMSILGILSLMMGSLIINVMFNMTAISNALNKDEKDENKKNRVLFISIAGMIFILISGGLFIGDELSSKRKKEFLIKTAKEITETYEKQFDKFTNYNYNKEYVLEISKYIKMISKMDKNFNYISIIVPDEIDDLDCFIEFTNYYNHSEGDFPGKDNFIFGSDKDQREYLKNVFIENKKELNFSSDNGRYELFYPYTYNGKTIVIFFKDYQRYGKLGS